MREVLARATQFADLSNPDDVADYLSANGVYIEELSEELRLLLEAFLNDVLE